MPRMMAKRPPPPADDRAARCARQRAADRAAIGSIPGLPREEGEARAVDLARRTGVPYATAGRLRRVGLVEAKPCRGLFPAPSGPEAARIAKARHDLTARSLAGRENAGR